MQTIFVELEDHHYPIYIGSGILANDDLIKQHVPHQAMIVSTPLVAELYAKPLLQIFKDRQCDSVYFPEGEHHKNLKTIEIIFDALISHHHSRSTTLIALGGGVVGDLTGFAAACYQRGVNFIQIPTSLLAQVDASIGGKTGVNHPKGKNQIGAFHQPRCVVIDVNTLNSLPPREFCAGLAEVIKYSLISDVKFFEWLEKNISSLLMREPASLIECIQQCCQIKANIVKQDVKDQGIRAILNFGHTFGHAIECATGYTEYLHGEAISIGMLMATHFSMVSGYLSEEVVLRLKRLLNLANLPTMLPVGLSVSELLEHMALDKKNINNKLRLIILEKMGHPKISEDFSMKLLEQTMAEYVV